MNNVFIIKIERRVLMTLEEAQNKILELEEAVQQKDELISSLSILKEDSDKKLSDYETEIQSLKQHNMNLFLKVSQQMNTAIIDESAKDEQQSPKTDWDSFMNEW